MSHSTPNGAAAPPPGKPAAAAVVTLGVTQGALASSVEALRQLSIGELDNLSQAVGLASRLRDALDAIAAVDDFLAGPYGTKA